MAKKGTPEKTVADFFQGKPDHTRALFDHFVGEFNRIGPVTVRPAKTMIGIATNRKRVAYVTQLGKNFIHIVFPFEQAYNDNLCFQKVVLVPGKDKQFNHHFRMLSKNDLNEEVREFMGLAYREGT